MASTSLKKNIVAIVQARCNSIRLPNKIMRKIAGMPAMRSRQPTASALEWLEGWQRSHGAPVFRAANITQTLQWQRIPRRIFQTVKRDAGTFAAKSELLQAWRSMNPEYAWHLFSEEDCLNFVRHAADSEQRWAYESLAVGAMRADYFRILALLHLGGVYADVDVMTRRALRTAVPATASMVTSPRAGFEFLVAEPHHPLLQEVAWDVALQVRKQVL